MSTFYKEFSVNPTTRELIDASPAVVVVQHDANVDGILFHIPASFDSVDLTDSTTVLQVFYMLPGDDVTYVALLTAYTPTSDMDASYKYYAWNFANSVLEKSGLISFSFCVQNVTTNQDWNTRVARLQIADTLDHTSARVLGGTIIADKSTGEGNLLVVANEDLYCTKVGISPTTDGITFEDISTGKKYKLVVVNGRVHLEAA